MSVDLEDKPDIYDDNQPSWKTNLQDDELEAAYNSPSATDDDLPEGHPSKSKGLAAKDLLDKEGAASKAGSALGGSSVAGESTSLFKGGPASKGLRGAMSRRRTTALIGATGVIVSGVTALTVMGPNLAINHLKEMLLQRISSVQLYNTRKYRQTNISKIKNLFSKDGRLGQSIVSEMERDGYTFSFDKKTNTVLGLTLPNGSSSLIGDAVGDHIEGYMEQKHPLRTSRWKTKRMNALISRFGIAKSAVVDAALARAGPDGKEPDPEKIVNKGVAGDVLEGENGKLDQVPGSQKDPKKQAAQDAQDAQFNEATGEIGQELQKEKQDLISNGTSIDSLPATDLAKVAGEAGDGITQDLGNFVENAAVKEGVGSKIGGFLKGLSPTDMLDKVCTIRQRADGAVKLSRTARAVKLIRYAMVFVSAADATRMGKADSKLIGSLMKRVTSVDKNGVAIGGSPGFAYMMTSKFSRSKNNAVKSSVSVDGQLTGVLGSINSKLGDLPGMATGCPLVQNPAVQAGVAVVSIVAGIFSGGASAEGEAAAEVSITTAIKEAVQQIFEDTTIKSVVQDTAKGVVGGLAFEGILTLTEIYIQRNLNLPFTGQEKGGQLGDILVAGVGVSNKQRSLAAGMVPATTEQYAQAQQEYVAWHKDQVQHMSIADRVFNIDNTDSLASNVAMAIPMGVTSGVSGAVQQSVSLASSILNPLKIFQTVASAISPKAFASDEIPFEEYSINKGAAKGTKLATDPAGNAQVIMRSDIASINPETNKDSLIASGDIDPTTLQPISDAFKNHVQYCVDNTDIYSQLEGDDTYDCLAKQPKTKQFKAHLAYLDMMDGLEAEFMPDTISESSATSSSTGQAVSPVDGLTWPLIETKAEASSSLGKCIDTTQKTICDAGHPYKAHDLFAKPGTQVVAAAAGKVIKAGVGDCGHGMNSAFSVQVYDAGSGLTYFYQHMDPIAGGITTGATVKPGDPIGKVGPSSAACNTSPHLHIDAIHNKGRLACSRLSCADSVKALFVNIGPALYKGYEVLQ